MMTNRSSRGLGKPTGSRRFVRVELIGIRSADFIRASGHARRVDRPDTWLHPTAQRHHQFLSCSRGAVHTWIPKMRQLVKVEPPIALGTPVTERPTHRSIRAGFPHTAPTLGI